eukprot:g28619.t1
MRYVVQGVPTTHLRTALGVWVVHEMGTTQREILVNKVAESPTAAVAPVDLNDVVRYVLGPQVHEPQVANVGRVAVGKLKHSKVAGRISKEIGKREREEENGRDCFLFFLFNAAEFVKDFGRYTSFVCYCVTVKAARKTTKALSSLSSPARQPPR